MSKYKLNWKHPNSLNYIACSFIVIALGGFLQFPVAIAWWVSVIYFALLSAFAVLMVISLRTTSMPANFTCTNTGKLEFIDNLKAINSFELIPALSLQSDYFCVLALRKTSNLSNDIELRPTNIELRPTNIELRPTNSTATVSSVRLRSLVMSSAVFYSPESFVKTTSEISFLLLPKDSLSDVCFRRLCRVLRQNRFLHFKHSG